MSKKLTTLEQMRAVAQHAQGYTAQVAQTAAEAIEELDAVKADKALLEQRIETVLCAILSGAVTLPLAGRDGITLNTRGGEELSAVRIL